MAIKGILFKDGKHEVVEFEDKLDNLYEMIDCSCFDCLERRIGKDKYFDLWVDDEFLLKANNVIVPSAMSCDKRAEEYIVGNVLIVRHTEEGAMESLTDEDIKYIEKFIYSTPKSLEDAMSIYNTTAGIFAVKFKEGREMLMYAY